MIRSVRDTRTKGMWHPIVICELCEHRHRCARLVSEACSFPLICHGCEAVLNVELTAADLAARIDGEARGWHWQFDVRGVAAHQTSG